MLLKNCIPLLFTFMLAFPANAQSKPPKMGRELFENKCAKCHGNNGAKGWFGAKNLQLSHLNDTDLFAMISNGKKVMPSWKKKLSEEQIQSVIEYIKTLRK